MRKERKSNIHSLASSMKISFPMIDQKPGLHHHRYSIPGYSSAFFKSRMFASVSLGRPASLQIRFSVANPFLKIHFPFSFFSIFSNFLHESNFLWFLFNFQMAIFLYFLPCHFQKRIQYGDRRTLLYLKLPPL